MRKLIYLLIVVISLSSITTNVYAKRKSVPKPPQPGSEYNPADYLILQSIGAYNNDGKGACLKGSGQTIGATGHFDEDHYDLTCDTVYINETQDIVVSVDVTKHAGADSDRWLLHEVENSYRSSSDKDGKLGLLSGAGIKMREINGSKFLYWGLGGGYYIWLSGQLVIEIEYIDLKRVQPEPRNVIEAYLQKYPSIITITDAELKSTSHNVQWIKDEMDRRLWLCDKWNAQFQAGAVKQADLIDNLVSDMTSFLEYREKYFNVAGTDDITALETYLENKNIASIQTKLTEYKTWWNANKGNSITLP